MFLKGLMFGRHSLMRLAPDNGAGATGGSGNEGDEGDNGGAQSQSMSIDYDKLASVIEKRSSSAADGALKGQLKEMGLTGDELNKAVQEYKNKKAAEAKQKQTDNENMINENAQLKKQILDMNISQKISTLAGVEGVNTNKIPFLDRLIDKAKIVKEDGNIADDEVIKKEIEAILKEFPEFKTTDQNGNGSGFQAIGSNGQGSGNGSVDAQLDAIFGVKKK